MAEREKREGGRGGRKEGERKGYKGGEKVGRGALERDEEQ